MRTTFYFDTSDSRLGDKLGDKLGSARSELSYTRKRILELIEIDSRISITKIAETLGYSTTAIEKNIDFLKNNDYLKRHGSAKGGYWEILK